MRNYPCFLLICLCMVFGNSLPADSIMMCTFFGNPTAKVFQLSDEGDITFDYDVTVTDGGEPLNLAFAPNGKWGLVGCNTTWYERTQITTILKVDDKQKISVLGKVHNDQMYLVAISPDSKVGVYGNYLHSIKFITNDTYTSNTLNNSMLGAFHASFSKLNGNMIARSATKTITEYYIAEDAQMLSTGTTLDISPSSGNKDLNISPDGKTCVVLSAGNYDITVLRVHEEGGFSMVEQFNSASLAPQEVDFTQDSRFAVISFYDSTENPNLLCFSIGEDSKLTYVHGVNLPEDPGEDMAVTPDGKYAVTRYIRYGNSHFYVVRINADGTLTYLPEKDYICNGDVSCIAFVPPQKSGTGCSWVFYGAEK